MIVKIKSEQNCWSYFEGDYVSNHNIKEPIDPRGYPDTLFLLDKNNKNDLGILLYIQKENKSVARIATNRITYIMNDAGKTIDKLI